MPPSAFADALPGLLDRHGGKLFALALRLTGNRADAEELLQDAMLQAHRKWHTFRGEADAGTWLFTIVARLGRRRLARAKTLGRMPALSQVAPWNETESSRAGVETDRPPKAAERAEARETLERAILTLPPAFRVPLVMKEILELPLEDVGTALGIRPETAKTRVHRARLILRKALMEELPTVPAPAPEYEHQVCVDLLGAKLDAMDHGRAFPVASEVICRRCLAVFRELDLVQDACAELAAGVIPSGLRRALLARTGAAPARRPGTDPPRRASKGVSRAPRAAHRRST